MPYIKQEKRTELDPMIGCFSPLIETPGDLNYVITRLIHLQIKRDKLSYNKLNEMIGVLECAKLELYRKIAGPYEDTKEALNGTIGVLNEK